CILKAFHHVVNDARAEPAANLINSSGGGFIGAADAFAEYFCREDWCVYALSVHLIEYVHECRLGMKSLVKSAQDDVLQEHEHFHNRRQFWSRNDDCIVAEEKQVQRVKTSAGTKIKQDVSRGKLSDCAK